MSFPRRALLIAAPAIIMSRKARAFLPHGGSGVLPAGDALATLLATLAVGQWKRISGALGAITNSALAITRANFDVYGTGPGPGTLSFGNSLGSFNAANMTTFSKGAIDTVRSVILLQGGGHQAYEDGSFYRFDVLLNCADVNNNVTPRGWTVAAKSALLTPVTDPKPASCHDLVTPGFRLMTGNGTNGTNQIAVTFTAGNTPVAGDTIGIAGQAPGTIPAGARVGSYTVSTSTSGTITMADRIVGEGGGPCNLTGTLTSASLQLYPSGNFWYGASSTGQSLPCSCHTYHNFCWIPGTTKCATGGNFGRIDGGAQPTSYVYDDSQADGSNVVHESQNFGGKGYADDRQLCGLPVINGTPVESNTLYRWDDKDGNLVRFGAPFPGGVPVTLASGLTITPSEFMEGVIMPDPVNAGKYAYFGHRLNQTTVNGFGMILNMWPSSGATYSNQGGTYTSNPSTFGWQVISTGLGDPWCYNSRTNCPVIYSQASSNGQMQQVAIDSSLNGVITNVFASTPTGDVPTANGACRIAYDDVHKCYIVNKDGDVYVVKDA